MFFVSHFRRETDQLQQIGAREVKQWQTQGNVNVSQNNASQLYLYVHNMFVYK